MGAIQTARRMQRDLNTRNAAMYLRRQGYGLRSALYILTGRVL